MEIFQVRNLNLKSVTMLGLLVFLVQHGKPGWALLAQHLLTHMPFIAKEFQQVVVITDSPSNDTPDAAMPNNNNLFGSIIQVQVRLEKNMSMSLLHIFHLFDQEMRTVVLIAVQNVATLTKMLDELLEALGTKGREKDAWKHAQWNPMYFFVWPSTNDLKEMSLQKEFMNCLGRFSCHIPLHADVFWIRDSNDFEREESLNTAKTDGNENAIRDVVWESYSVKDQCFVQTVNLSLKDAYFIRKLTKFKWQRRGDFNGALIIATAVVDPFYSEEASFKQNEDGSVELDHGSAVSIFRTFRHHLNFTERAIIGAYMLEAPSNDSSEETYKGMEILLETGLADISITENALTDDKAAIVQFLHSTTSNWLEARFSEPPNSRWKFFLSPFSPSVWSAIIIYIVVMMVCVGFYRWMGEKDKGSNGAQWTQESTYFSSSQLDFLWALGTLCQQGWYEWPKQTPVKVLFLVASTTGFLIYAAYSGTITSKLSVQDHNTVTFERLLNKSYSFYMENDFDFPVDISQRPQIRVQTLYTLDEASAAVSNISVKKSAFISYPEFFYAATRYANFTAAETCSSFTTIRTSVTPNLLAMAVRKLSPFKEIFNVKTLYIWERGTLRRIVNQYMATTQLRCVVDSPTHMPQTLSELFIAYASIGFGAIVAAALLIIEISVKFTHTFIWHRHSFP